AISSLIAVAIIFLGQAIVAYEIFTGKALPRRGLRRHWRNAIILALGYGGFVALSQVLQLRLSYSLLLATILMTLFYALLNWRSYAERERYIDHLRPFVASQRLYEHLLVPTAPHEIDIATPFRALCRDVLGTRVAYLAAVGSLAPLVGPPLSYPASQEPATLPWLSDLLPQFTSPQMRCVALEPAQNGGALWAIPLWSERGLIGVLLLGEKRDGGLYTQEEIEIAGASGERLIDTLASTQMAQRLMALQRKQLAASQVLDQQTRRVLHDDVLPCLHTAMISMNGASPESVALLTDAHRQISNLLHDMPTSTAPEVGRWGLVGALQQLLEHELGRAFDEVSWQAELRAEQAARTIPSLTAEVIFYAAREVIRNAARYGRGADSTRPLHLRVSVEWRDGLALLIEDDGVGMERVGPSRGGSGQGLALHSTMMAVIGGALLAESAPGRYTRVTLTLPQGAW
ncbi:MAG: hypothetical protein H0T73_05565, partial [Ardenticatenales bacterium]|nr:hypothetical protein [Ardenticatenales bacterium]